jgi:hypothetical protein
VQMTDTASSMIHAVSTKKAGKKNLLAMAQ